MPRGMTNIIRRVVGAGATAALAMHAHAATLTTKQFGTTTDGHAVELYTMTAPNGLSVSFMNYGGVITAIRAPDRQGHLDDIVLSLPSFKDYEARSRKDGLFFGALIGRFANRIAGGRFTLDGKGYSVPTNDGPNSLHGGKDGFDDRLWSVGQVVRSGHRVSAELTLVSPDGDQGFPGELTVKVTYSLSDDGSLGLDYQAKSTQPTVLNLTNHSYFNLAGVGARDGILDQMLVINASRYTPVNETLIPTGELATVAATPFDFRVAKPIGRDLRQPNEQLLRTRGYDHNWVLDGQSAGSGLTRAATLWDPVSGRQMVCDTTEPGLQVYTSNSLNGTVAGNHAIYRQSDAVTFETQHFPDSPNQPSFPITRLNPGKVFHSRTVFRFGIHQ